MLTIYGNGSTEAVRIINNITLFSHLPPDLKIYSIDGTETALEMGIVSYSQPIRKMAAATIAALKNQQRLGTGWRAKKYYFKGKVSER